MSFSHRHVIIGIVVPLFSWIEKLIPSSLRLLVRSSLKSFIIRFGLQKIYQKNSFLSVLLFTRFKFEIDWLFLETTKTPWEKFLKYYFVHICLKENAKWGTKWQFQTFVALLTIKQYLLTWKFTTWRSSSRLVTKAKVRKWRISPVEQILERDDELENFKIP